MKYLLSIIAISLAGFIVVSLVKTEIVDGPGVTHTVPEPYPPNPAAADELISRSAAETQNPLAGWKSNDELQAVAKGEPAPKPVPPSGFNPVICTGANAGVFTCYQKHYQDLVKKTDGVKLAFADLRTRYEKDPYVVSMCHPITHVIGNSAVEKYSTVSEAYTQGDSFCWSGYYHGVLEGIVAKVGPENISGKLNTICADVPGRETYSFDFYNCIHGLGHGLMAMTDNELFDSLKICDNLVGPWEQSSCYGGVFMENVIVDNKNHYTKYLKPEEPLYPCTAVEGPYKSACYLMQTSYALKVTQNDFSKVFEACRKADAAYITTCYQSLGRDASGQSSSDVARTKATCDLGATYEERSNCIIGASKDFVSFFHSDVQAKNLCAALSPDLFQVCTDTVNAYYKVF